MLSLRKGTPRAYRIAAWAGLLVGGALPSIGCQVEYAGMTLPSGKYMRDDVQYFSPGTNFPWANTQAATQRARMAAQGMLPKEEAVGDGRSSYENLGGAAPAPTSVRSDADAGLLPPGASATPPAPPAPMPPAGDAPTVPGPQ